ncbi:YkgJ family cysteine cluster protein [Desulforudis sp. DRI-14]|uniref:YkgJ family cysteine cluster protein n=1 Tax=Desulforudis sp. DRI-14 TaxID=3459793 RepID=UPI0040438691
MLSADGRFCFSCHRGLACFGSCCRDVNIFLSPYDVLRLKRKLGVSSSEFLQEYTLLAHEAGIPLVQLKMREGEDLRCPFVGPEGCRVYDERPWSCRMAPVDIKGPETYTFVFDSAFCLGLNEPEEWTVTGWMADQGLDVYEEVEALFKQLPGRFKLTGLDFLDRHLSRLVYMACYDVDRFREFVFDPVFLEAFEVSRVGKEELQDDVALLKFGFAWLMSEPDLEVTLKLRDKLPAL